VSAVTVWAWVLIWTLLLLGAAAVFAVLGRTLYRKASALVLELGRAGDQLAAVAERLEELEEPDPGTAAEPAIFASPSQLRLERLRPRRGRHRAVSEALRGAPGASGRFGT
jgi:hypothetical protein